MKSPRYFRNFAAGLLLLGVSTLALAQGGSDRGGGDLCEARIKLVRDDIKDWIEQGGSNSLTFPAGVDGRQYSTAILKSIEQAKVMCVGPGDDGYPVEVNGTAKVCRFDREWFGNSKITCNYDKFQAMEQSDQYILVHHEYAGLAGLENPNGADSVYEISNQISGYLTDVMVKRLAVRPQQQPGSTIPDPKTVAIFERLGDAILNTQFLDCDVSADSSDKSRIIEFKKKTDQKNWLRFQTGLYPGQLNLTEYIPAGSPSAPIELRATGENFATIKQKSDVGPFQLSLFIYLDPSQKTILKVGYHYSVRAAENIGTIPNPIEQYFSRVIGSDDSFCTAKK